jgi:hypothetical protein
MACIPKARSAGHLRDSQSGHPQQSLGGLQAMPDEEAFQGNPRNPPEGSAQVGATDARCPGDRSQRNSILVMKPDECQGPLNDLDLAPGKISPWMASERTRPGRRTLPKTASEPGNNPPEVERLQEPGSRIIFDGLGVPGLMENRNGYKGLQQAQESRKIGRRDIPQA